jgi:tetratricopeptide (TPR) repeat protein
VKIARIAAAVAAALAGVVSYTSPARAASADYEFVCKLVEHRLHFVDLAERVADSLVASQSPALKAEGLLAKAYLLKAKGDSHRRSEPKKRREYYEGNDDGSVPGALQLVSEFEKAAARDHRLRGDAVNLKSSIQQELTRVYEELIQSLPADDPLGRKLREERTKMRRQALAGLEKAISDAEDVLDKAAPEQKHPKYVAYVTATQRYILALVKGAEGAVPFSEEQKAQGKEITGFIEGWYKRQSDKRRDDPPEGVKMWMNLHLGRGYVFAGDMKEAVAKGFGKVKEIDPEKFDTPEAQKWAMDILLRSMFFEAEALYEFGLKTGDRVYFEDAQKAIGYQFSRVSGSMLGIRAVILKGQILGKLKEYESALSELDRAVTQAVALGQSNLDERIYSADLRSRALKAMSEIVLDVLAQGRSVDDVTPEVLVEAGVSCYRQQKMAEAIGCFREAIRVSRRSEFGKRAVKGGEPYAWYYMGVAYQKMDAFLDAQLAYEGALDTFLEQNMPAAFAKDSKNAEIIKTIRQDVLEPSVRNGRAAAGAERRLNPSKFNKDRFIKWVEYEVRLDPSKEKDLPYYKAEVLQGEADELAREARELAREDRIQQSRLRRQEALELYDRAKQDFLAVPEASALHEEGLYQAGVCCYQQMDLMSGKGQTAEDKAQLNTYADEALANFGRYRKFVKETAPRPGTGDAARREQEKRTIEERRGNRISAIDLYEPFILFAKSDIPRALAAAEKLRNRGGLDVNQQRGLHRILLKCYMESVEQQEKMEDVEGLLKRGEEELEWFKKDAASAQGREREDRELACDSILNQLATAYGKASRLAIRKGVGETFGRRFQERQATLLKELLGKDRYNRTPDGLLMVAKLFIELDNYEAAFEAYERVLDKFDTDNNRIGLPDDQLVKFGVLGEQGPITNTSNVRTSDDIAAVRAALVAIEPFVYGLAEQKNSRGEVVAAAVPPDYDRANRMIEEFFKTYPDYDGKSGSKGKARLGLDQLNEELIFRLQLLKAANGKTTCLVRMGENLAAEALQEKDPAAKKQLEEDAKKNFDKGLECARDAARYWPKDAEVKYNLAVCLLESGTGNKGRLEEAKAEFDALRAGVRTRGEMFWKATKGAVKARIMLGQYTEARGILVKELLTDPEGVKQWWPDFADYIKQTAERLKIPVSELVPAEVPLENFSYRPKSELERLVDSQKNLVLPKFLSQGKITREEAERRVSLLDELVSIFNDNRSALVACSDDPLNISHKITAGVITSLSNIGGKSRGASLDRAGPPLKTAPAPKAVGGEVEEEGGGEGAGAGGDGAYVAPVNGGAC